MKCGAYENFFKNFSSNIRMNIIIALKEKSMSVGELCETLKEEQSKVSHNLKKLADCNFVIAKQEGKQRIYSLNKETIVPVLKLAAKHVAKNCCEGCKI